RPRDGPERAWQDRRHHWHPEDGQIWVQQAQGTSVADAGDGRSPVYPLLQSEQVHAGSDTGRQVRRKDIGTGRTARTAPVKRKEGGQEAPHYPRRSFATRSTYKNRKAKEKEFYPTYREELIEEALRKIACDNLNGIYLDNAAGVQFTLYELKKE